MAATSAGEKKRRKIQCYSFLLTGNTVWTWFPWRPSRKMTTFKTGSSHATLHILGLLGGMPTSNFPRLSSFSCSLLNTAILDPNFWCQALWLWRLWPSRLAAPQCKGMVLDWIQQEDCPNQQDQWRVGYKGKLGRWVNIMKQGNISCGWVGGQLVIVTQTDHFSLIPLVYLIIIIVTYSFSTFHFHHLAVGITSHGATLAILKRINQTMQSLASTSETALQIFLAISDEPSANKEC